MDGWFGREDYAAPSKCQCTQIRASEVQMRRICRYRFFFRIGKYIWDARAVMQHFCSTSLFSLEQQSTKEEMEKRCSHKLQMLLCRQWYSQKRRNYRALLEAKKELQAIAHRLRQLTTAVYSCYKKHLTEENIAATKRWLRIVFIWRELWPTETAPQRKYRQGRLHFRSF